MKPAITLKLARICSVVLAIVLLLVPFHAFLTVYTASLIGHYDLLRLWKEILLLLITPLAAVIVWRQPELRQRLRQGWLFWAIACYVLLHILLGVIALAKGQVNSYALLYAWVVDLRPLLIFVLAFVAAWQVPWLYRNWYKLLLAPAVVVVGFGLLQATVLPHDVLSGVGYGPLTIEPYETVDQKLDYVRIQSTLRGANPLGAYMVVVLSALVVGMWRVRRRHWRLAPFAMLAGGLVVLSATYSRSAYIGAGLAALALAVIVTHGKQTRRYLAYGLVVFAVIGAVTFTLFRDNDRFENTFFHTNEHSQASVSSNEQRLSYLGTAVQDVAQEPFGRGPGTAGPASVHNSQPVRIAENYYLQIGQEVGWLGLGLFVAVVVMIGRRLWRRRDETLPRILLISLVGISFINLVQHAWTDDTLALVWWGLAGIALAGGAVAQSASARTAKAASGAKSRRSAASKKST